MRGAALLVALATAVLAAALAQAGAGGAAAAPPAGAGPVACAPGHVPHLGQACLRPDGFFDVVLADGTRLRTHGPDPLLPDAPEPGFEEGSAERAPACSDGARLEVLYGRPSGASDRLPQVADDLRGAIRRMNAVLAADAADSGGPPADFKVACDARGDIRVSGFTTPSCTSAAYTTEYGCIVDAARAAGFKAKETDYVVFYDAGSTVCGVGNLYGDASLSAGNSNMEETGYGVVYDGCWFGRTPMHENGHTQGAVQDLAPMWDGSGHCIEGLDVMCYPSDDGVTGTATLGLLHQCSDRVRYDCNFDTYFDAAPEAGEWLATNWNIGDPVNRYLAFGDTALPRAGTPEAAAWANGTAAPAAGNATAASASGSATPTASRGPGPSATPSGSRSASPSTTGWPARTVADRPATGTAPPSAGTPAAGGPVTVEIPAAAWPALAAVGAGALALRRRLG